MADEPRELFPYRSWDSKSEKPKLDFRIQMGSEPDPEPEPEPEQAPDPKDSSVPEPVTSFGTQLTIELNPVETVSAAKDSGKPKASVNGKQTSSAVS